MQLVTALALPSLPVEQPDFATDPMPYVEAARCQHPWLAKFSQGYVVHGYQATKDLIYMDDKLRPNFDGIVDIYGAQGTSWARFMEEMIVTRSGPDHTRLRASVALAFTPRSVNRHRALMRQVISKLLDEWAPSGQFDFALFASYFPVTVMCGLLGVSAEPIPRIRDSLEMQVASLTLDRKLLPALLAGYDVLWNFADTLVVEREKRGGANDDSLLDALIAARTAGQIDETELRFMLMVLLTAGYDTSKNMLTLTMHMMLKHPQQWARCAEDRAFCAKVVEEMLRHSAITTPYRAVAQEFVYGEVRFPKGTMLIFATALAGRDPAAFPDAMEFQPERVHTNRHLAFGRGAHICLGQHLARTQLQEGLQLLAQRITKPRLAGEVTWRPFLGVWGLRTLPIAFEPAPARERSLTQAVAEVQAQGCPVHQPASLHP
jgi:cytochrome P450